MQKNDPTTTDGHTCQRVPTTTDIVTGTGKATAAVKDAASVADAATDTAKQTPPVKIQRVPAIGFADS